MTVPRPAYVPPYARWQDHPGVRSGGDLTPGERAADLMRNSMGSWPFVLGCCVFLTAWSLYNGRHGFDPYPFILLNLLLSCMAALQGAILLIAAKRSDQISSELAKHDFEASIRTWLLVEQMTADLGAMQDRQLAMQGQMAMLEKLAELQEMLTAASSPATTVYGQGDMDGTPCS